MNNKRKILIIVFIGLLTFTFSKYFYQLGFVNGISMEPTLKNRQLIIIKNTNANIKKNDIVIIQKQKTITNNDIGVYIEENKIIFEKTKNSENFGKIVSVYRNLKS